MRQYNSRPPPSSQPLSVNTITGAGACTACHRRMTKCATERPRCEECQKRNTCCIYEDTAVSASSPHIPATKRKHDQLQAQFSAYEELYNLLQTRPDNVATEIFRRIRQGADVQSILRHVQDGDLLLQISLLPDTQYRSGVPLHADLKPLYRHANNPYLDSVLYRSTLGSSPSVGQHTVVRDKITSDRESVYHTPYYDAQIIDARLNSATLKISNWTSISSDEKFLRKLLETYFLFEYPFYPFFHKDIFLDDMIAGRHDFCSSLLVNTILASACHGLGAIKNRSEFWNPRNYGYQFLAEAKRLWELEQGKAEHALTTIQTAPILGITYFVSGLDKIGWSFWTQAVAMAENLDWLSVPESSLSQREKTVRTITVWGIFAQQATSCFYFVKPPLVNEPPKAALPDRGTAPAFFGEIWIKYPHAQTLFPLHLGHTFLALAELRKLMNDIGREALSNQRTHAEISLDRASTFHAQLRAWYQGLPEALGPERIVLPPHLLVHMQYHNLMTMTFSPLIAVETAFNPPDSSTSLLDYINYSPAQTVAYSKTCLETLLHMFYQLHGFESYYAFLLQILIQLGFDAVEKLWSTSSSTSTAATTTTTTTTGDQDKLVDNEDIKAVRSTLMLCAKGLRDQGRNFYLSEVVFRVLKDKMREEDVALLRDWARIGDEEERDRLWREHVHGEWPVNVVGITQDPEGLRLDNLVRGFSPPHCP
ncbi:hypothetical protein K469DRAFT_726495 [Zopfia rhizophila CBS 207.26]|uniref:Zn(2)-C6 fungal-type domain-containing protein n=1 Tax=Zopfia rhizophila CBS 207.26 TaxID=1314779 RepID=A0A6A6E2F5_9PEZI|nr:hypothetical protein K469DRAFT_726495 [Zopfia rhizophila CBS 207.26]